MHMPHHWKAGHNHRTRLTNKESENAAVIKYVFGNDSSTKSKFDS
jgi:hypothetical protein